MNLSKPFTVVGLFMCTLLVTSSSFAGEAPARVFQSESGAKMVIAPFGPSADKTFLIRFDNFNNPWDGKVILHHFVKAATNNKYEIRVETGKKLRPIKTYVSVVDGGKRTLANGSIVPVFDVYLKGGDNPYHLAQTQLDASLPASLQQQFKSEQYKVDF